MYFEVNCKQRVIFIQYSQRVLYVHARRVLSIYTCMSFILRETRTTVREWACCLVQINKNYDKITLKFIVLFFHLLHHYARRKGNNLHKKGIKTNNFRIKSGMCIWSIFRQLYISYIWLCKGKNNMDHHSLSRLFPEDQLYKSLYY